MFLFFVGLWAFAKRERYWNHMKTNRLKRFGWRVTEHKSLKGHSLLIIKQSSFVNPFLNLLSFTISRFYQQCFWWFMVAFRSLFLLTLWHSTHKHYIGDLSRFVQAALVESVTVSPCVENSQIYISSVARGGYLRKKLVHDCRCSLMGCPAVKVRKLNK